jgi:hypothetical protein
VAAPAGLFAVLSRLDVIGRLPLRRLTGGVGVFRFSLVASAGVFITELARSSPVAITSSCSSRAVAALFAGGVPSSSSSMRARRDDTGTSSLSDFTLKDQSP